MRRSLPLALVFALYGCAAGKSNLAADCKAAVHQTATSFSEAANDAPLDPTRTFGPSQVIMIHPPETAVACR